MHPEIRNPEEWVEQQEALLETYIERVFESETLEEWFSASHWYFDAIVALFLPQVSSK